MLGGFAPLGSLPVWFYATFFSAAGITLGWDVGTAALKQVHSLSITTSYGPNLVEDPIVFEGANWTAQALSSRSGDEFTVSTTGGVSRNFGFADGKVYRIRGSFTRSTAGGSAFGFYNNNVASTYPIGPSLLGSTSASFDFTFTPVAGVHGPYLYIRASASTVSFTELVIEEVIHEGVAATPPTIEQVGIAQVHQVVGNHLVLEYHLATPVLTPVWEFVASGISTAPHVLAEPALTQVHWLDADDFAALSHVLGEPAVSQAHALDADELVVGPHVLDAPIMREANLLAAHGFDLAAHVLGEPGLSQIHIFSAGGFSFGSYLFGTPGISQVHVVSSSEFELPGHVLGNPDANQAHTLTAPEMVVGPHILGNLSVVQINLLSTSGFVLDAHVLGAPVFRSGSLMVFPVDNWQLPLTHANHDGVWKKVAQVYFRRNGVWHTIYRSS